jgi:nucleotide-binding universal stress UspA family protein
VPEIFHHLRTSQRVLPISPEAPELERELSDLILDEYKGGAEQFPRIDKKIREGIETHEILREAAEWQPTLLVVGTHGRSALGRIFLGSVSDRILRQAHCSVLVVPETASSVPRRILAAVDADGAAGAVLRTAALWSRNLGADLAVLHVLDEVPEPALLRFYDETQLLEGLHTYLEAARARIEQTVAEVCPDGSRPPVEVRTGRPFREIASLADAARYDLIVLGAHSQLQQPELGHTAVRVAHQAHCPVLVVRAPREMQNAK